MYLIFSVQQLCNVDLSLIFHERPRETELRVTELKNYEEFKSFENHHSFPLILKKDLFVDKVMRVYKLLIQGSYLRKLLLRYP